MKVDGGIPNIISKAGAQAAELEKTGYSGGWTAETSHDPFLPLVPAAEATSDLELGTSIAVAFARNPMTLANTAWDLQMSSQGRFILGLGSQIKPHITKRFSMEWSHPAARMREMILAIRAIWDTWENGTKWWPWRCAVSRRCRWRFHGRAWSSASGFPPWSGYSSASIRQSAPPNSIRSKPCGWSDNP